MTSQMLIIFYQTLKPDDSQPNFERIYITEMLFEKHTIWHPIGFCIGIKQNIVMIQTESRTKDVFNLSFYLHYPALNISCEWTMPWHFPLCSACNLTWLSIVRDVKSVRQLYQQIGSNVNIYYWNVIANPNASLLCLYIWLFQIVWEIRVWKSKCHSFLNMEM